MKSCIARPALAALALALAACASPRPGQGPDSPYAQLRSEIAAQAPAAQDAALPPEVAAALLPPVAIDIPKAPERRFDIDVRDVDARTFFMSLLHDSAENIVVHPAVDGTLTLSLRNVSVPEVLTAVRDVYGYDVRRSSAGWQVFPAALQSRMFNVNYINLKRDGRTETRVSSGQLRGGDDDTGSGSNGSAGRESSNPASSQIETTSSSRFWTELEQSLRLIVGVEGGGEGSAGRAVVVNPHTGLVLVRGMPAELREVEFFLQSLQDSVTRQVLLEAKILEVELSDGFQTGINWAGLKAGKDGSILVGQGPGYSGTSQPSNNTLLGMLDETGAFSPFTQGNGLDANAFGGIFSVALQLRDFGAFIELLKTQGDVQVLSSPRIATMNNQKAVIKVGSDEFFVTRISSNNTTTGTTTTTSPEIELTPFFSGIALDVTPQIDASGDIILHVRPAVSEVVDQTKTLTVFGQQQTLPLAFSTMRESDSIVRAKNGQIIVIGGLMQDSQRDGQAGLPVLGDLPVVGHLFRHTQKTRRKTELVILLKPIVVDDNRSWQDDLAGATGRIDGLLSPGGIPPR
ncbi:pilus (MSHA type) biogenesis protein MshL [Thauera sp. CAU 1555]|uniref:Pilus (MSHA type) biogenesis protein MshL n=1 Tax=Thauera sedimentorum TaxID=2767595 RepID=A0ABR9BE65_9RHOO|nr:pilus (MSHA type) biogenesis protein MshL [Thauera sedimentorum]MBC9073710.1 pilus (MSHA type) biogenesis protein MshL [Thauera sedimentorum]MBD8504629.1 pilus (MSHA type) biogenesis protein MshL [Thauera sedimentorum]